MVAIRIAKFIEGKLVGNFRTRSKILHHPALRVISVLLGLSLACGDDSVGPVDTTPGATTQLTATPVNNGEEIAVTWTNPTDADFDLTLLVRYVDSSANGTPATGANYAAGDSLGDGTVLFAGDATAFTDSTANILQLNTYQTWTRDLAGNWCTTPQSTTVSAGPSGLSATVMGRAVNLAWTNPPPGTGLNQVKLLRRLNSPPDSPDDVEATLIFSGTADAAADSLIALFPDTPDTARIYHYAVFGCTDGGDCETRGARTPFTLTVTQVLLAGGYTIYWRHALADVCADRTDLGTADTTSVPDWWRSCDANCPPSGMATARQLGLAGMTQAVTIGTDMKGRGIPIGRILSSEFCRCFTTAELMAFPMVTIEQRQGLSYFVYGEANRCASCFTLIDETPILGTNTALIGHAGFQGPCETIGTLSMGEAAIFKPDGTGGRRFIRRVLPNEWNTIP